MNECHPSIRSVLLPINPLDTERSEEPGEGYARNESKTPCMFGQPDSGKLRGASGPVATGPDADGRDRDDP